MQNFQNLIESLKPIKISNEKLYNVAELEEKIKVLANSKITISDCILTIYYVDEGKRYELYEYELSVDVVKEKDFGGYLLRLTGKETIDEIPPMIIERQKKCHIEILKSEQTLDKFALEDYLEFVINSPELKKQITQVFGTFAKEKLYFEIY